MIENLTFTVIIPVYKAENFLHRCIDSVINQTYNNFELLLIDDGSPDRSGNICDEYAAKDSRIRVFHKANGGVSSARNIGLENAKGEWITFVDSDDWLSPLYIEHLASHISETTDLVFSYATIVYNEDKSVKEKFEPIVIDSNDIEVAFLNHELHWHTSPWSKLYRRDIIEKRNLRFCENMHIGEDAVFLYSYILHCKNISFTSDTDYFYNYESISSLTKCVNNLDSELYAYTNVINVINKLCIERNIKNAVATTNLECVKGYYARRVLNALYHDKSINFKTRIKTIKSLNERPYTDQTYIPSTKEKILAFLLNHRYIYTYDLLRVIVSRFR